MPDRRKGPWRASGEGGIREEGTDEGRYELLFAATYGKLQEICGIVPPVNAAD